MSGRRRSDSKLVDRLGQHRVAEAIDDVRELGNDRGIDRGVEAIGHEEGVDRRLDLAREFLEHEVLVLHLGAELRGLEQALAVPDQRVNRRRRRSESPQRRRQPFVEEGQVAWSRSTTVLGMLDQPVVLGVEDVMDRGEADILVGAAVASHEVRVQAARCRNRRPSKPGLLRPISMSPSARPSGTASCAMSARKACDVRIAVASEIGAAMLPYDDAVVGRVRNSVGADARDHLRHAVRAGNEVAVRVGAQQRHAADILIGQQNAQHLGGLRLDLAPVGHAAIGTLDQLAGRNGIAVGVQHVLTQEHLVRRVRGIGLVLVDERGRRVGPTSCVSMPSARRGARVSTMKLVALVGS